MSWLSIKRRAGLVAVSVFALCVPASFASAEPSEPRPFASHEAAVPGLALAKAAARAVYLDDRGCTISYLGGVPNSDSTSRPFPAESVLLGCTPGSGRDNPHYSSGDVSGHGW